MKNRLNFSPTPFHYRGRHLIALWLLNGLLLAAIIFSVSFWLSLRAENRYAHQDIDTLKQKQEEVRGKQDQLARDLEALDLKSYGKRVRQFHQIQAAFQTHWGHLLDDLGSLLPEDVRIISLRPQSTVSREQREMATLKLSAEARTKEAQLEFIRILQRQPAFLGIRFESESYDRSNVAVVFELLFDYRPGEG